MTTAATRHPRGRRRWRWAIATPLLQVAVSVALVLVAVVFQAGFGDGWGFLVAVVGALLVGPSVALGVVVALVRRHRGVWRALGGGAVSAAAALVLLMLLLNQGWETFGWVAVLALSAAVVAWVTPAQRAP